MLRKVCSRLLALPLIAALALAELAVAAPITIDIRGAAESALPIAVVPFRMEGNAAPPPHDVAGIITSNLQRSGKFEPIAATDMLSRPSRMEEVQFQQWRALGVDNLVVGSIQPAGPNDYQVRFELLDVYKNGRLLEKAYRVPANSLRDLAHNISDLVYEAITGQPGAFNTKILYVTQFREEGKKKYQLIHADADGERPTALLTSSEPIMSPAWSADRQQAAYVSFEGGKAEVWVQPVYTKQRPVPRRKVAAFPGLNSAPAWAPNGRQLALTLSKDGNPDIYVLDLDTARLTQVTRHWAIDTAPVWTPDGRSILFVSERAGGAQIYRVAAGGGEPERLTFTGRYNAGPDISPDGKLLAMVHRTDGGDRIAVLDLQTKQLRVLTQGPLDEGPSFAPNGAMLIYSASRGGSGRLATVSVYGRADQPLGLTHGTARSPAWSPR
jgi:TolB protein